MKKVLFVSHSLELTGAPRSLFNLLSNFPENVPFHFHLVSMVGGGLEKSFRKICPTTVFSEDSGNTALKKAYVKFKGVFELILYLINFKPDLVFINSSANFRAITISKLLGFKVFVFVREYDEMYGRFTYLRKKSILIADKVFVTTENHKRWVLKNGYKGEIVVLPNGIDIKNIHKRKVDALSSDFRKFIEKNKGKYVVGHIGKMTFRKGWDLFLEIMKYFRNRKDICFSIIGDFASLEEKNFFQKTVKSLGMDNRFHLTGMVENIFPYLDHISVLAFTSRKEVFPRTILECGILGIPIVAFRISDLVEIFPKGYPYLVPAFDIFSFCKNVEKILNSTEERKNISNILRYYFKRYDIKKISQRFAEIILKDLGLSGERFELTSY